MVLSSGRKVNKGVMKGSKKLKNSVLVKEKQLEKERAMVAPVSEGRFSGKMDSGKLNFFFKMMMKMMKAKDADHRDWDKIREWVSEVAES
jgi:menaquinone-dependent protoporphyrinogen IX oxidase